jgi:WD40 repeat protein
MIMRTRQTAWWLAAALLTTAAGCSGSKRKSALDKRREAEAAALARLNAKNLKGGRPPRAQMTPEQFAQHLSQPFGDTSLPLIDPEGNVFRSLGRVWERDIRFDAGNAAWNKATATLYGASRSGRDVVSLNLHDGSLRIRATSLLRTVPKKVEAKNLAKNEHTQSMEPTFELTPTGLVVAQSVPKRGELEIKVAGIDPSSGRVRWRKTVPNPWDDGFTLWSEGNLVLLGDSSKGPVWLFDAKGGPSGKIEFPKDESYVFAGSDGSISLFYHFRKTNELFIVGHRNDGSVAWRKSLADCYPNMAYFQPIVDGVLACKVRTSPKEHIDRVMKIAFADGKTLWEANTHKRPQDVVNDPKRKDWVGLRAGKNGAVYFRNRFAFVRVEKDGRVSWSYPLNDKEVYIVVEGTPYRSENVMGGDEPYDLVVSLDPQTGKPLWSYKEEKGLPARGLVRDGVLTMHGETQLRAFSLADGRMLLKKTFERTRIEGVSMAGGVCFVDTSGIRQAYRLSDGALLLFDKSEDETVVNTFVEMPFAKELYLYHDEQRRLGRAERVAGDLRLKVPASSVRTARILTAPAIEVDRVRFVDGSTLEFQSLDDKRAWRVPATGGAAVAAGPRREGVRAGRRAAAFLGDPVKVEERFALRVEQGGATHVVTALPRGDYSWSKSGHELAYAEKRAPSVKNPHVKLMDLALRVFDARSRTSRDVMVLRGADENASLASVSFGPGDRVVTFAIEGLYGSHFVGTVDARKTTTGEMKISEVDGEVSTKMPKLLAPTKKLGMQEGSTFGDVAWSPSGQVLAYTRGQRLHLVNTQGRDLLAKPEAAVSKMRWSPDGRTLIYVKDGNLWSWRGGEIQRLSYLLPKREPRSEEEEKNGNLFRIASLEFSPDGKQLAFALRWPYNANLRAAVLGLDP